MSKISQLHAELMEQASELGFESIGEAEQAGYGVDWENAKLIKMEDEQDKAHKAWLEEKEEILRRLQNLYDELVYIKTDDFNMEYLETVKDAIEFIKRGEV